MSRSVRAADQVGATGGVGPSRLAFTHEFLPLRVRFGEDAATAIGEELTRLEARRVVVIASRRLRPLIDRLAAGIAGMPLTVLDDVRQHVPVDQAARATALVEEKGADTIVSIGGGSATGLAKAIARSRPVSVVAVPTTYSGSEMTPIWGMTSDEGKHTGRDPAVLPDVVVYDPSLTAQMPPPLAAASGLNALAHAVEALYAPDRSPVSDLVAVEAVRHLDAALPKVAGGRDGSQPPSPSRDAASDALYGAFLAGLAIGQAGASFHHKVCHVLGGRFGMPHAETHAALLPHSVAAAAGPFPEASRRLAEALDTQDAAVSVRALADDLGIVTTLAQLGLGRERLGEAVEASVRALGDAGIPLSPSAIEALLTAAFGDG